MKVSNFFNIIDKFLETISVMLAYARRILTIIHHLISFAPLLTFYKSQDVFLKSEQTKKNLHCG